MSTFGMWLLRSVRRDGSADSPVEAVERLSTLPRPIRDADKDILVGAVLALAASLQMALNLLLELLPHDESRERLGEVLCPTLGQLQRSLDTTLSSFRCAAAGKTAGGGGNGVFNRAATLDPGPMEDLVMRAGLSKKREVKRPITPGALGGMAMGLEGLSEDGMLPAAPSTPSSSAQMTSQQQSGSSPALLATPSRPEPEPGTPSQSSPLRPFPVLEPPEALAPAQPSPKRRRDPAADLALMKALRSEMRVNAAIQVAVESLEFAEGQLRVVKEVNRLHGGSFDLLTRHFYQGYNRILLRALELERREFDSPPDLEDLQPVSPAEEDADARINQGPPELRLVPPDTPRRSETFPGTQRSPEKTRTILFENEIALPPLPGSSHPGPDSPHGDPADGPEKKGLVRRNTIGGPREEDTRLQSPWGKPAMKRRLSLADELAMLGEDGSSSGEDEEGESAQEGPGYESSAGAGGSRSESDESEASSEGESEGDDSDLDNKAATQGPGPRSLGDAQEQSEEEDDDDDEEEDDSSDDSDDSDPVSDKLKPRVVTKEELAGAIPKAQLGMKSLRTRVDVISPPTSPERPACDV